MKQEKRTKKSQGPQPQRKVRSGRTKISPSTAGRSDTVGSLVGTLQVLLARPIFVAAFVLCAVLALSHAADPATSILQSVAKWLEDREPTKAIGEYLLKHMNQLMGAVIYVITVLVCAPDKHKSTLTMSAVAAAFLIPESSVYQYGAQGIAAAMYFQNPRRDVRTVILIAVASLWFLGIIGPAPRFMGSVSGSGGSTNNGSVETPKPIPYQG